MPVTIAAPPQRVPIFSGFDYVTVDEQRHRAYAAHPMSRRLVVIDSLSGRVLMQVEVGPMHGVAVDPATGNVFTGDGTEDEISRVDADTGKILASVQVPGSVDAIAYDSGHQRIYADQAGGTSVYVIDAATMKFLGAISMPSGGLESPAIDPATGVLFQNLADGNGFAIVDPALPQAVKVVPTPQLERNHPLVFSPSANQVIVGGVNGVLSAYTPDGVHIGDARVQSNIDQCNTGSKGNLVVCAGRGIVSVIAVRQGMAPLLVGSIDTGAHSLHTVGIDESTNDIWVVYTDARGDWVQRLRWAP
jgi:DNA-binding beta-propeller fold protein YncE